MRFERIEKHDRFGRTPQPVRELIKKYIKQHKLTRKLKNADVYEAWQKAVVPYIKDHTRITGIHRNTLRVTTDSAALFSELSIFQKEDILRRLNEYLPDKRIVELQIKLEG